MKVETNKNTENIKKRIIEAIKFSGMSQRMIAKKINITDATLSDYIHKDKLPSLETFARLCEVLDVSADEILGLRK